ncbi:hypothetical protein G7K71_14360 [Desulfofundulus sp. TPOSR]|uniref:hypothetical protein n=1 Tax=Desulfofundulus sp. TPOSR TaxID=2714340 RepID=UPI00140B8EE1|nr:hypothetical protein [Desulfofundulus sp. TPOSR]NHM28141.1 hypothetical protein [Desulfofundulus sp. TPOSR]
MLGKMLRFSRKRGDFHCAGLDLETGRAVLVKNSPAGPEVVRKAEAEPRPNPADTALALLENLDAPEVPVVVGLAGEDVMVKTLRLPGDIGQSGIPDAVRWQFTDAPEGSIVRFAVLGQFPGGQYEVLAAAAPETLVKEKAVPLRDAGARLLATDLRVCALWRAAKFLAGQEERSLAAVEVSPSGARVACGRDRLEFAREITGENLEFEVRRTLGYYQSQYGAGEVAVVRFGPSGEVEDARFATALGLALWPFAEPKLDFLPKKMRKARRIPEGASVFPGIKAWTVAAGLFFALAAPYAYALACGVQARSLEREAAALAPKVAEVREIRAERKKLEDWTGIVESFDPVPLAPILSDVRYAAPSKVWLTGLELTPEKDESSAPRKVQKDPAVNTDGENPEEALKQNGQPKPAAGQIRELELPPEPSRMRLEGFSLDAASVGLFRDNLTALPWCERVESLKVEYDEKAGAYRFEMTARVKGGETGAEKR